MSLESVGSLLSQEIPDLVREVRIRVEQTGGGLT